MKRKSSEGDSNLKMQNTGAQVREEGSRKKEARGN